MHKKPEHEACLDRSDQYVREHAPCTYAHMGGNNRHPGQREESDPNKDEGLRACDMVIVFHYWNMLSIL
jgi:hypothetical protein